MARIRTIKPDFWTSEQVMECSPLARLLFIGLWNFCDDGGNHPASPKTLKAEVFPGDDFHSEEIRRLLDELVSNGLLTEYEAAGKAYWHVTGWHHQKIDKPSFKHPRFGGECDLLSSSVEQTPDRFDEDSSNGSRMVVESSPTEGKGREGKGYIKDLKPKAASKSPRFDPLTILLPNCIDVCSWNSWIVYRRSRKLTCSEHTVQAQIANLTKWANAGHNPTAIIHASISNGWQGLFEPKSQQGSVVRPLNGRQAAISSYAAQAAAARANNEPTPSQSERDITGEATRIA